MNTFDMLGSLLWNSCSDLHVASQTCAEERLLFFLTDLNTEIFMLWDDYTSQKIWTTLQSRANLSSLHLFFSFDVSLL